MVAIDKVKVENFRSIIDSGEVEVASDITTLVGPNEAGKSNFLKALKKFEVSETFDRDDVSFYVEPVSEDTPMITIDFVGLDGEVLRPLRRPINRDIDTDQNVEAKITKMYDGSYNIQFDNPDFNRVLSQVTEQREEQFQSTVEDFRQVAHELRNTFEESEVDPDLPLFIPHAETTSDLLFKRANTISEGLEEYINEIQNEEVRTKALELEEQFEDVYLKLRRYVRTPSERIVSSIYNSVYKEGADLIEKEINIESLKDNDSDSYYVDLLELANIAPERFEDLDSKMIYDNKQEAAKKLEEEFNEYWPNRENAEIEFDIDFGGGTVSLHITDNTGSTDLASHRSTGFRHFLSFYIRLVATAGEDIQDQILLLDSPGIHLHPESQRSLKNALEKLAEDNQVIYSTHSPSMVYSKNLGSIKLVNHSSENGTNIHSNLTAAKEDEGASEGAQVDVLAPVRKSLGASFADSPFANEANILVEGYIDRRLITSFAQYLETTSSSHIGYDTNLIDVAGSKQGYLAKVLSAEGYEFIILLDSDQSGKQRKESLLENGVDEDRILLLHECVSSLSAQREAEIEDLFDSEFYVKTITDLHDELEYQQVKEVLEDENKILDSLKSRLKELEKRERITDGDVPKAKAANRISEGIRTGTYDTEDMGESTVESFTELIETLDSSVDSII